MASFTFRAQTALDLRQQQEEDAKRALGLAQAAVATAADAVTAAETHLADGLRDARNADVRATDTMVRAWLRNWVAGQRRQIAALQHALAERRGAERTASRHLVEATRRLRALVQLRDRLWQEYQHEERRAEQRELNWLGSLRHVAARAETNEAPRSNRRDRREEVAACQ